MAEGCNQACSFCAIPSFKGKLNSRPVTQIVDEVIKLSAKGFFDFSFVSQDSSSYGRDRGENEGLIGLIDELEKRVSGDNFGRILYLYPSTTTKELISRIEKSSFLVPYFDMPIQHISQRMLKIMKRGAGSEKIKDLLEQMRNVPNSFVRTSVIVGHPGETQEDFDEMCTFLENFAFDRVTVFAYSDEEDTAAYEMEEKVPQKIVNARLKKIEKIIAKQTKKQLEKRIDTMMDVVVNGESEETELLLTAKATLWAPEIDGEIYINDADVTPEVGKRGKVLITGMVGETLLGQLVS